MARARPLNEHHPRTSAVVFSIWVSLLFWVGLFWAGGLIATFIDLRLAFVAFAPLWLQAFGLVLAVLGLMLVTMSAHVLLRYSGHRASPFLGRSETLVQEGVYGLVRHPMYLGFISLAYGYGVLLNSVSFTVGFATLVLLALAWKARVEDRELAARHGARYHHYRRRTRGFAPLGRRVR